MRQEERGRIRPPIRFGTRIQLVSERAFGSFQNAGHMVFGGRFLGSGFWGLVSGKWFLGSGSWEVVSGWEVASGWKLVFCRPVSGKWFLGTGFWESGFWQPVSGKWFLGTGFWEVVSGHTTTLSNLADLPRLYSPPQKDDTGGFCVSQV